ncbi:phosphogluconate dehydrogenase (NADP(+)-dependent, decarboxylating) [Actinopolyspora erythraea]|uniref:6-phosphogluconate dehydrogenase, decarboxylating n=1 Tax=Actinopolyspora erythraea TaxID=414996 RepID=A0A099D713_9ACTN|nr:NADP-dependent phosphogluconate dehydrogenase [Actinopolyspora erythraea]ASU78234.1 phosphogluconate dehydrogenase (NADP(+)-dependent, decarboxylating) [Actinopolyspora erythraea]KGI81814.1 6-phosphogluconate dehydrogenase [Actinopolyspora erythraea]
MSDKADIGVTGLAVMGRNLARNLARNGQRVAVHNRHRERTDDLVERFGGEGEFVATGSLRELVESLERPRRVVIMVKAGPATDAVIDELVPMLDTGDVLVDAGNANFTDTRRREAALAERGVHFVGTGVSGGEEGALHGPSIMPGGSAAAYRELEPVLRSIAANVDGTPCVTHVGADGAGHFVKMVHNGIEYADMQLIAETYDLLRKVLGREPDEIAETFRGFNTGRLNSYLIEITAEVLGHVDARTSRPFVDVVLDQAEQKGTGRWTVQNALELASPVTGIAEAVFARSISGQPGLREAAADLPGPSEQPRIEDPEGFVADVERALYASKIVAYAQGFDQIQAGSATYGWNIDLGAVATIWRGGCIIRAEFLDRIRAAYDQNPGLASLLADEDFRAALGEAQDSWRRVVATATASGVPVPGISTALAYYDTVRARRLPAALIQGQRDYFGAHTYRRTDVEGIFHTEWAADRSEHEA